MGSATKELDRIFSEQKRYGKIGVSLGQGYWESLNTTQRDNLLIRARVRINKPSDQILFDGLPKPFQGIINRRASNVTLNPKIDKEQELTTRKKVYGDFKNKSKSARVEAVRQRLAIVRKPSPSAFKLPEYTELDYEAWHDKVHDTEWRLEDAYDSGIFPEDYDWDSLDFQLVNKPWKARSGFERQKLRPYYQKMMSGELSWQKDPTHYTSGKLPQEARTYIKPGFSSHITTDARVPTDPDAYYEVHPKDIADKETNVSQMDLDDPSKYGKSVRIQAVRQRLAFKPPEESFGMIDPDVFEEKTNPKGNKRIPPSRQRMQWLGPMGIPTRTSPFAKDMLKKNKKQSYKPDPITKKRHKIKSEGLTEGYIDKYNLAKQKSARIQMARERLGAVGKADVAPERVISTKNPSYDTSRTTEKHGASVYIEGTGEPSPLEGRGTHSQTELQKRTFNRIIKPKPKSKKPSDFKTQEEKVNYLKEQRMLNKQQSDDDYERMESQYISEDAINKNKWAKLRQRLAIGIRVSPATKRVKRVKKVLDYEYPYQGPEVPTTTYPKTNIPKLTGPRTTTGEERRRKVTKKERKALDSYIKDDKKIDPRNAKLRQRIAGLGFRERILNWLKEQPRFKSFDPDSSFVGGVKYDQDNQSMQITLNGKKYDFCNVEERLFDSFSGAGSKGAFFNREIKSLHNCGAW